MPIQRLKTRILVVDDQPLAVQEMCEFLETHGFKCTPSYNSLQAIDRFKEDSNITLVLCDLFMPGYDGIELIQHLKSHSGTERTFNAVLISAQGEKEDIIRALRAGFSDYHQKPVNLNELVKTLKKLEKSQNKTAPYSLDTEALHKRLQDLASIINNIYTDIEKINPSGITSTTSTTPPPTKELTDDLKHSLRALSPRQLEVAKLVSLAKTNYQISCDLGITENTVKLYVSQILSLTGTSNRTQLALILNSHQINLYRNKSTPQ